MAIVVTNLPFQTGSRSILEALGTDISSEWRFDLFEGSLDRQGALNTGLVSADYDFDLTFGLDAVVERPKFGSFEVDYPIRTSAILPDRIAAGEAFSIATDDRYTLSDGRLVADKFDLGSVALNASVKSEDGLKLDNIAFLDVPLLPFFRVGTDLELGTDPFEISAPIVDLDASVDWQTSIIDGLELSGSLGKPGTGSSGPVDAADASLDDPAALSASVGETVVQLTAELTSLIGKVPQLKPLAFANGGFDPVEFGGLLPGGPFAAGGSYNLFKLFVGGGFDLVQSFDFLPSAIDKVVEVGGEVLAGTLGDSLDFTAPQDADGPLSGQITYDMDGDLNVTYSLVPSGLVGFEALSIAGGVGTAGRDADGDVVIEDGLAFEAGPAVPRKDFTARADGFGIDLFKQQIDLPEDSFAPVTQEFSLNVVDDDGGSPDTGNTVFSEEFDTDPGWTYRSHTNALPGNTVEHQVDDGDGYMEIAVEDTTAPWYNVVESPTFARQSSERGFTVEFRINPIDPAFAVHPGLMLSDGIEFAPQTQIYSRAEFLAGQKNDNFNFVLRYGSETDRNRSGSFEEDTWYDVTITSVAGTGEIDIEVLEPDGDVFYEKAVELREPLNFDRILIGETQGGSGKSSSATARIGIDEISIRSGPPSPDTTSELNLNDFTAYGEGDWQLAGDGKSVRQNINTQPTAFVSKESFINSKFEGSFTVETNRDGDWIGFVFGFGSGPGEDFYVFKWKQDDQQNPNTGYIAREGYELGRVTGGFDAIVDALWEGRDDAEYQTIATATGSNLGWRDYETYNFELVYNSDRAEIRLGGADPLGPELSTIFEFRPSDVGLSEFSEGRFGFYNSSQKLVRYNEVSQSASSGTVPAPASLPEPILEVTFDDGIEDSGPNGLSLSTRGTAHVEDRNGDAGAARDFDGQDDQIVTERSDALRVDTNFSFSGWIAPDGNGRGGVAAQGTIFDTTGNWQIYADENEVVFNSNNNGGVFRDAPRIDLGGATDIWHHVAFTWDNGIVKGYKNGVLQYTFDAASKGITKINATSDGVKIGSDEFRGDYFSGGIDDVRIYDETLTQGEVLALAEDRVPAPPANDGELSFVGSIDDVATAMKGAREAYEEGVPFAGDANWSRLTWDSPGFGEIFRGNLSNIRFANGSGDEVIAPDGKFTDDGYYTGISNNTKFGGIFRGDVDSLYEAEAILAESADGHTLMLSFRGTDDTADAIFDQQVWDDGGLSDYYNAFWPLIQSVYDYAFELDDAGQALRDIDKIIVSGHSLGGATADAFTALDSDRFLAAGQQANPGFELAVITFASPGLPKNLKNFRSSIEDGSKYDLGFNVEYFEMSNGGRLTSFDAPGFHLGVSHTDDTVSRPVENITNNFTDIFGSNVRSDYTLIETPTIEFLDDELDGGVFGVPHKSVLYLANVEAIQASPLLDKWDGQSFVVGRVDNVNDVSFDTLDDELVAEGGSFVLGGKGDDEFKAWTSTEPETNLLDGGDGNDLFVLERGVSGGVLSSQFGGHNIVHGGPGFDAAAFYGVSAADFSREELDDGGVRYIDQRVSGPGTVNTLYDIEEVFFELEAPPELSYVSGRIHGDPHLETIDGLAYDFQAAGEFILIETEPGAENPFQVQTRFEPWKGSDVVSVTTRMAVEMGDTVVEVDATGPDKVLLDGAPLTAAARDAGAVSLVGDAAPELTFNGDLSSVTIVLNDTGEKLEIANQRGFLNITTFLTGVDGGNAGNVRGLLGDAERDGTADDLALRDGTVLASRNAETLYGPFADSWRLDGSPGKTALFSNSVSFPDPFPATAVTVEDLPDDRRAEAEAKAIAAGLSPGDSRFDAAVLDYALTGEDAFIGGSVSDTPAPQDKQTPNTEDRATATFGVLTDVEAITEGDGGTQAIEFEFYRTGDVSDPAALSYVVGGDVRAGDFKAGTSLSGEVSFSPDQEMQSLTIEVLGDLQVESTETLEIEITGTDVPDAGVAMRTAAVTIETDDFPPNAKDDGPVSTDEDTPVTIPDVLANDTDPDQDPLSLTAFDSLSIRGAKITNAGDGTFLYDPSGALDDLDEGGTIIDTFSYTVGDGNGGTDSATVSIAVSGVAEPVLNLIEGTGGQDALVGTESDDLIVSGGGVLDTLLGKGGSDIFDFQDSIGNGARDVANVLDFQPDADSLGLDPDLIAASRSFAGNTYLNLTGGESDMIILQGVGSVDEISFV